MRGMDFSQSFSWVKVAPGPPCFSFDLLVSVARFLECKPF